MGMAASWAAQRKAEHLQGQDRPEIPVPRPSPGWDVLAAVCAWLQRGGTACPGCVPSRAGEDVTCVVCWTSAAPAALTQGKPDLCRILLLLSDAAFTAEPSSFSSGQGDGEFLQLPTSMASACWGCCGLLSKSLEISSEAPLLAEAICISDIRPASFPRRSALISWHRALCQM